MLETKTVANGPSAKQVQHACHDTLDFIQVPGYPSAIRVFALTTLPPYCCSTLAVAYLFDS